MRSVSHHIVALLCLAALLAGLSACGSSERQTDGPAGTAPPAVPGLPAPGDIDEALLRRAAYTDADGRGSFSRGDNPNFDLPNQNTSIDGTNLVLTADAVTGSPTGLDDLAYAIYQLDSADASELTLKLGWDTPEPEMHWHVGLGDWAADRWRWFAATADEVVDAAEFERFVDGAGRVLVCVVYTGTNPLELAWVSLGDTPLNVTVSADVEGGLSPLNVVLTASAVDLDGSISRYEWDLDADGTFEIDTAKVPSYPAIFIAQGVIMAAVRVTDDDLNSAVAQQRIFVYNEHENNDDSISPSPLNFLNVGDIGVSNNAWKYDGDTEDWYRYEALTFTVFIMQLNFDETMATPSPFMMLDADAQLLPSWLLDEGLALGLNSTNFGTFHVTVNNPDGAGRGYQLNMNYFSPLAACSYSPKSGTAPLAVNFNASVSTGGEFPIESFEWDWDADGVYDENTGTTSNAQHAFSGAGLVIPRLRISDGSGIVDIARMPILLGTLDETEDNDSTGSAPELGPVVTDFSGHVGAGGYNNDGDTQDLYTIQASSGQRISVRLTFSGLTADLYMKLFDQNVVPHVSTVGVGNVERLDYLVGAADPTPFVLLVEAAGGESAYQLDVNVYTP